MANQTSAVPSPIAHRNLRQSDRPVQDEWGFFDPKQAGVEALVRKVLSAAHEQDAPGHEVPVREKKK